MEKRQGKCHCGAIEFEVELENGIEDLRRCNCSLCRKKGAVMASVPLERLKILRGISGEIPVRNGAAQSLVG